MASHPSSIAIVGLACVYPDARTPAELWENVMAQRRSFRHLPAERLRREDYWSADRAAADRTYSTEAALIEGYEFDRVAFRVVGSTFRSADLAHWLALDVASKALADAGFPEGRGLPRESTGVLLGNTLTGEFSRASTMRLRWPYVRRVVEAALAQEGWETASRHSFLERLEADYKAPFAPPGEETLAGNLSNTIAGRICNQFDFKGGGYTVDGACASSLLAVANACSALTVGDLDVAVVGGVDLSLDPFELVGFAKTGALAPNEMRVFDRRSEGFWPGEGCGFAVLMRQEEAIARGCRVYALIRGWGISSDGSGGITRPEAFGQLEALRRAYRRAGFGIDAVSYCEGHGTGTAVGDATELEVLSRARREASPLAQPAVVGSIKANIGHTKAAAGIAGLIKATMAVHTQVLPPTTGCEQPQEQLSGPSPVLRVLGEPELWPKDRRLCASVSAMGFGGINAHIVLENVVAERRQAFSARERSLSRSPQDAELFVLAANSTEDMREQISKLQPLVARLSRAELVDFAAQLQEKLVPGPLRSAIVASKPAELENRLQTLNTWLERGSSQSFQSDEHIFLGSALAAPRIAFLFPGQGSPTHLDGGCWRRRFESVHNLYAHAALPAGDSVSTRIMQPAVVTASLAGLKVLAELGLEASAALGHSLGEFTALHWAGALSEETLVRIVRQRGAAMAELGSPTGAMVAIAAPAGKVQAMLRAEDLSIVGFNSPRQTVVAGEAAAISRLAQRALAGGWQATLLPVSHAFHTPLVAAAVPVFTQQLAKETLTRLQHPVLSTITGALLPPNEDLQALLCKQITAPVRFADALAALADFSNHDQRNSVGNPILAATGGLSNRAQAVDPSAAKRAFDLLIEVGPGAVLTGLVRDTLNVPVFALDAGGASLKGLLQTLGAAFALGAPVKTASLFADRVTGHIALDWKPRFFVNPCELAPLPPAEPGNAHSHPRAPQGPRFDANLPKESRNEPALSPRLGNGHEPESAPALAPALAPLDLVRLLVAERAELPVAAVKDEYRMLSELHLNSISVGQLVSEAAGRLGLPRIVGLTDFANASVAEMARALEELKAAGAAPGTSFHRRPPPGVDIWIETFAVELVEAKLRPRVSARTPNREPWPVFAPVGHTAARSLAEKLALTGGGVLVWLPENPTEEHLNLLLAGAKAAMAVKADTRFVLVQHGWGGAGFARTLHLENPGMTTVVVNVPPAHSQAADWVINEVLAASGYAESHYDAHGTRRVPRVFPVWPAAQAMPYPIGPADVLLVTGGGKGIAAECALAIGVATGARLALMGRSDLQADGELASNLQRMTAAGVQCCYVRADVTDAQAVAAAVAQAEKVLGPVTALLHGAGTNVPRLIGALDDAAFRRTVSPKVQGARNLLAAIDPDRLRLFVTFGSIIARSGLPGEADYATANEWMTAFTEHFQAEHSACRCLALEWSVWSGVGMGERLGRVDSLIAQGIMPIPPDEGVRILLEALQRSGPVARVVSGRFGEPPTLTFGETELPLLRFLERKRVLYPGIELIVDARLSVETDPYLDDHLVQKQRLLPAVLGLEAMAQSAMALLGATSSPSFERVELTRPVAVSEKGPTAIRIAALRRAPDLVEVCLRSQATDYHVDHFRAFCRFNAPPNGADSRLALSPLESDSLALDPKKDLYGRILFHRGRFCRVRRYRLLRAKECVAEITADDGAAWFGPYMPGHFVLGDPAARDAAMHAIQACIPHQRILPTAIEGLTIYRVVNGPRLVRAKERLRHGNQFIYDVEITDPQGEVIERWEGLHLRAVELMAQGEGWPDALLGPYLERRVEELAGNINVTFTRNKPSPDVTPDGNSHSVATSDAALQQALGKAEPIWRRPDGKPVASTAGSISAAHAQNWTLAVAGGSGAACDLEFVTTRSESVWRSLLTDDRFRLAENLLPEQGIDAAATRVWTAIECLKKSGLPVDAPLVLESHTADGWVLLRSGGLAIATCLAFVRGSETPLVAAIALPVTARPAETAVAEVMV